MVGTPSLVRGVFDLAPVTVGQLKHLHAGGLVGQFAQNKLGMFAARYIAVGDNPDIGAGQSFRVIAVPFACTAWITCRAKA